MNITKDIEEAITKNLPAVVGEQLVTLLEQGKEDNATVVRLRNDIEVERRSFAELNAKHKKALFDLEAHAALATREDLVLKREQAIEVRELKQDLAAERRISVFAVDVVTKLVRNTEYRSSALSNGMVPLSMQSSPGYQVVGQHPTSQSNQNTNEAA